eukprot:758476-Hanusia_phi.AAC.2
MTPSRWWADKGTNLDHLSLLVKLVCPEAFTFHVPYKSLCSLSSKNTSRHVRLDIFLAVCCGSL